MVADHLLLTVLIVSMSVINQYCQYPLLLVAIGDQLSFIGNLFANQSVAHENATAFVGFTSEQIDFHDETRWDSGWLKFKVSDGYLWSIVVD